VTMRLCVGSAICVARPMSIYPGTQESDSMGNRSLSISGSRCWGRSVTTMASLQQEQLRKCCLVFRKQTSEDRCSGSLLQHALQITLASLRAQEPKEIASNERSRHS